MPRTSRPDPSPDRASTPHPSPEGLTHDGLTHDGPPTGDADLVDAAASAAPGAIEPAFLPPGRAVDLPGRGTTWIREVTGPPGAPTILLLHGWSVTADVNWFAAYGPLGERYRVLAMDLRGHGRGLRPQGGVVRLTECADDAVALLDELGIDRAIVAGYSMGGPVAQLVWRRHPERVAGLVLCSTARNFQTGPVGDLWYRSYGGLGRLAHVASRPADRLLDRMVRRKVDGDGEATWMADDLRRSDPAGVLTAMASLGRFRSNRWIGGVDVPTGVVVTTRDRTVPPGRQRALARAIPGAEVFEVDGAHDVCARDPERWLPAFLAACRVAGASAGATRDPAPVTSP